MNWWIVIRDFFNCDKYKELYIDCKNENEELKRLMKELLETQTSILNYIK
jgi:Ribonuclease G/E